MTKLKALSSAEILEGLAEVLTPKPATTNEELEAYIAEHSFDRKKLPPEDSHILFVNGQPIGSRCNIVSITGKAKSRKTVVASAVATACFIQDNPFLNFTAELAPEEVVLIIDTEQGYYHFYQSTVRIMNAAGYTEGQPRNFHAVRTRDATRQYRTELTEYLIEKLRPAVVILDGVSDYVANINDQEEATDFSEKLLAWTDRYNLLLIAVIHTTKTTGYMTGALGTTLEKKSQTVIKVEKPEEEDQQQFSHISCQYARDMPFKTFTIEFNEQLGHYVPLDASRILAPGKGGDRRPQAIALQTHEAIIVRAFAQRSSIPQHEVTTSLMRGISGVAGFKATQKDAKAYLDYYNGEGLLYFNPVALAWMRPGGTTSNHAPGQQAGLFANQPADGSAPTDDETTTDDLPF